MRKNQIFNLIILATLLLYLPACYSPSPDVQPLVQAKDEPPSEMDAPAIQEVAPILPSPTMKSPEYPEKFMIDAPEISQLPAYLNGCEITSLAMMTTYMGLHYSKEDLAEIMPRDSTQPKLDDKGNITVWGDPDVGFVGDITGNAIGYSVYNKPLEQLLNQVYPPGGSNLTGSSFAEVEHIVASGRPVVVWTTETFQPTDEWITWSTPSGKEIKATLRIHVVLLVGYDEQFVYVNNPLNGQKAEKVEKSAFVEAWNEIGRQALTYKEAE